MGGTIGRAPRAPAPAPPARPAPMPDASLLAARENKIFPVEAYGDTLIVLPKGDKAGFGQADFRVESARVAAALKDPRFRNLLVDFSLTNYVGGDVVEEVERWAVAVREDGGRVAACDVSDDMAHGLKVSPGPEWTVYETRETALKSVARETPGQTFTRWVPALLTALAVLLVLGFGVWLLTAPGRGEERERYRALDRIWKDYADLRGQYPDPREWAEHTPELTERLDAEIAIIQELPPNEHTARAVLLSVARDRMRPILLRPRLPDERARGVEAGFAYLRADMDRRDPAELERAQAEYSATGLALGPPVPGQPVPPAAAGPGRTDRLPDAPPAATVPGGVNAELDGDARFAPAAPAAPTPPATAAPPVTTAPPTGGGAEAVIGGSSEN